MLYLDHSHEYRMVDVDKAVRKALAEGKRKSRYIGGDRRKSLRFHASGLKNKNCGADALTGFKRRRAVIVNCALTQQRARCWHNIMARHQNLTNTSEKQPPFYSQAASPCCC